MKVFNERPTERKSHIDEDSNGFTLVVNRHSSKTGKKSTNGRKQHEQHSQSIATARALALENDNDQEPDNDAIIRAAEAVNLKTCVLSLFFFFFFSFLSPIIHLSIEASLNLAISSHMQKVFSASMKQKYFFFS